MKKKKKRRKKRSRLKEKKRFLAFNGGWNLWIFPPLKFTVTVDARKR